MSMTAEEVRWHRDGILVRGGAAVLPVSQCVHCGKISPTLISVSSSDSDQKL